MTRQLRLRSLCVGMGVAALGLLVALHAGGPSVFAGTPAEDAAYAPCVEKTAPTPSTPRFTLSHAYPSAVPPAPAGGYPWEAFDFKTEQEKYIRALLAYARADLEPVGWDASQVPTKWFHAPWMASGPESKSGREFFHGMTEERAGLLSEYVKNPPVDKKTRSYAVGYYNAVGAYTFGRVFTPDPAQPDISKALFENGAMTIKLLFTTATQGDLKSLANTLEWDCDIYNGTARSPSKVYLLQVDVAVRDKRNDSLTGWVFGTFAYNGGATGVSVFDRLEPVGLMWGNDPTVTPTSGTIVESWLNKSIGTYQHYGRAGRLNGPIDNPLGSCTACHGFAQIARVNNPTPGIPTAPPALTASTTTLDRYFTNVKAATALSTDYVSVDYSLQLQLGISRAINAGQATLPTGLNSMGRASGHPRPVATHLQEIVREEQ